MYSKIIYEVLITVTPQAPTKLRSTCRNWEVLCAFFHLIARLRFLSERFDIHGEDFSAVIAWTVLHYKDDDYPAAKMMMHVAIHSSHATRFPSRV